MTLTYQIIGWVRGYKSIIVHGAYAGAVLSYPRPKSDILPRTGTHRKEKSKMAKISDFTTSAPYEADYVDIMSIVGENITIVDVKPFENVKGRGIHALITRADGKDARICTHGVAIVDMLSRTEVLDSLAAGDFIRCRFVKVQSTSDKTRQVLKLTDPEDE